MEQKLNRIITIVIILIIALLIIVSLSSKLLTDFLWFKSLNYEGVFTTILLSKIGLQLAVGIFLFFILLANLLITRRPILNNLRQITVYPEDENVLTLEEPSWAKFFTPKRLTITYIIISAVTAFLFGSSVTGDWVTIQKFLHPSSFGINDPLFHKDLGFYIFKLPFYLFIFKLLAWAVVITGFWIAIVYFLANSSREGTASRIFAQTPFRYHLSFLAAVYFILKAWGYRMDQYLLLYSPSGAVYGPGFTNIHANLVAYKVLLIIALICAAAILVNLFLQRFRLVVYSIGTLLVASILLNGIYPALIQKFIVEPNEFVKEKQYIKKNIEFTRKAYNLDLISEKDFPAGKTLTVADIEANKHVVNNIRLWDWRPLKQTYGQIQEMRLYYEFKDVDIDRYKIDGQYRQVMLAARELNQSRLAQQAQTWVNEHLVFTHGYGVAMSPVNEFTAEGLPKFFLKDIPPVPLADLTIKRPEIYYGEETSQYVIVNTKTKEFDYPYGDENIYTTYKEKSGVELSSPLHRLLFAFSLKDYRLLLSGDISSQSQVLFYRNIRDRVPKIAPFLQYDSDPYLVISNGRLYWMWDAYTTTNMYPYAEPFSGRTNYIRNSVKAVVDAYNGKVDFYISDPNDPVVHTFSKIFPGMLKPLTQMPADLRAHIRYPQDLFMIQAKMYAVYHMRDPQVFYNKEDKWSLPTEVASEEENIFEPYYTVVTMPGEKSPEYALIFPFTPQNKKNMIAWLAARSEGENYGKLILYSFPKQELVYGPMQIRARINQDAVISQQITLWSQRGSQVLWGNLLIIPIKDSLLYIEPLYLQAEQSKLPELRRIIVAHGNEIVMEPTLEKSLERIFGEGIRQAEVSPTVQTPQEKPGLSMADLIRQANNLYDQAQARLKNGDWAGYGEALKQLKDTLNKLAEEA